MENRKKGIQTEDTMEQKGTTKGRKDARKEIRHDTRKRDGGKIKKKEGRNKGR